MINQKADSVRKVGFLIFIITVILVTFFLMMKIVYGKI